LKEAPPAMNGISNAADFSRLRGAIKEKSKNAKNGQKIHGVFIVGERFAGYVCRDRACLQNPREANLRWHNRNRRGDDR
jgi:hypothetical protein